jgi:hypothetical protein
MGSHVPALTQATLTSMRAPYAHSRRRVRCTATASDGIKQIPPRLLRHYKGKGDDGKRQTFLASKFSYPSMALGRSGDSSRRSLLSAAPTNKVSKTERKRPRAAESVMQASRMALTQVPTFRNTLYTKTQQACVRDRNRRLPSIMNKTNNLEDIDCLLR